MFERRLKIFLAILIVAVLVLLARAMELQVVQRNYWRDQAAKSMRDERLLPTTRGRILDRKGQVLAHDEPCLDACVDYRIIASDQDYIGKLAAAYIKSHELAKYRAANTAGRKQLIDDQIAAINEQIRKMWIKLAQLTNQPLQTIEETRQTILSRIQMRRRMVWHSKLVHAESDKSAETKQPWYRKWLMGEQDGDGPQIDDEDFKIEEETSSHVILEAIDKDTQNELSKHSDDYPGLELKPAMHRVYPFGAVGCHVIGHLGRVTREDLESDGLDISDDLRGYKPADVIGRDGLEALGEPTLRGSRGEDVIDGVTEKVVSSTPPKQGDDLHSTIDIELQQEIEKMFDKVSIPYDQTVRPWKCDVQPMHGAAVVIEVATGNVLALVSAPGYDPNKLDEEYPDLVTDRLNQPLMNRATQAMLEPGSTVKPMVGLGAITQGVLGVNEGIECTGYLVIAGKHYGFGKCWTVATCKPSGTDPNHHPIPIPHHGHDGNPDGFLTYSDALERSCNIFFETTADRLKIDGLTYWLKQFGLGRPTGIGIAEVRGHLPEDYTGPNKQFATWTSGIGQGQVLATPIQMANVAATIARRGIWVRPSLLDGGQKISPFKPRGVDPGDDRWNNIPVQTDLHLSPIGLDAAFKGMTEVVNGAAGTGTTAFRTDMIIAGKTGTAQAAPFFVPRADGKDGLLRDDKGKYIMEALPPSTHGNPNKDHPWYRATDEEGKKLNHAWFIGFAPANAPKYAISVMVEYGGGGGGVVAGPIGSQILDALIEHGYLAGNGTKISFPLMP